MISRSIYSFVCTVSSMKCIVNYFLRINLIFMYPHTVNAIECIMLCSSFN